MEEQQRTQIIEIWKTIVEVQRHFNDIAMRIRSMFITILLALFAAIGFLLDKKPSFEISDYNIQFATILPLFGIFGAWLFYFIDRYWYHRLQGKNGNRGCSTLLIVGSVKHALEIEKKYKSEIPELSLSDAIGKESPYKPRGIVRLVANLLVSHNKYSETGKLHSDGKIELFYKSVVLALFLTMIMLASLGGVTIDKKTPPAQATPATIAEPDSTR